MVNYLYIIGIRNSFFEESTSDMESAISDVSALT